MKVFRVGFDDELWLRTRSSWLKFGSLDNGEDQPHMEGGLPLIGRIEFSRYTGCIFGDEIRPFVLEKYHG